MIFLTMPAMLIALVPVIAIESYVILRRLDLSTSRSLKTMSVANIASTIIGIPVTWFVLVVIQVLTRGGRAYGIETRFQKFLAVTWQAPWLIPYESDLYWMIPAAGLALLIPFFFASWHIEYQFAKRILSDIANIEVNRGVFLANLTTYLLLGVIVLGLLITASP